MRAVIIDDDELNSELIANYCEKFTDHVEVVGIAENVQEGITVMLKEKPDLLFLDIELHDEKGFDILEAINQPDLMVIVVSAHEKYALRALKGMVIDFLTKPLSIKEFVLAIDKCNDVYDKRNKAIEADRTNMVKLAVPCKDLIYFVLMDEILHIQSSGSYTIIKTTKGEKFMCSKLLKEIESKLPSALFMRVHHSHIVNTREISRLDRSRAVTLYLSNNASVPVSSAHKNKVLERLLK